MVNIIMSYSNTCIINIYSLTEVIISYYTSLDISTWITFLLCFPNRFADRSNCTNCFVLVLDLFVMGYYVWESVILFWCNFQRTEFESFVWLFVSEFCGWKLRFSFEKERKRFWIFVGFTWCLFWEIIYSRCGDLVYEYIL